MSDTLQTQEPERSPKRYGLMVGKYALEFKHETGAWPVLLDKKINGKRTKIEVIRTRRTLAIVLEPGGPDRADLFVAQGEAYCSPHDTYDYEVGRQTALYDLMPKLPKESRAPKMIPYPAAERQLGRQLMRAYLSRVGALPWVLDEHGHLRPYALTAARLARRDIFDGVERQYMLKVVEEATKHVEKMIAYKGAANLLGDVK